MRATSAVLGCQENKPDTVIDRANRIIASQTGNLAFATPSPALATIQTQVTAAESARTAWDNGNGTTADHENYKQAIHDLFVMVKQSCAYVNNLHPNDAAVLATSGFILSDDPNTLPLMEPPQNLHRFIARNIGSEKVKLACEKPANAANDQRVTYKFFRGTTPDFQLATVIHEATHTSHIDEPAVTNPTVFYYWATAFTPAGESDPSDVLKVTVVPL